MSTTTPAILDITASTWLEYDKAQYKSLRAYLTHLSGLLDPYKLNCPPERINAILLTPHAGVRFSGIAGLSTYLPLASNIAHIPGTIIIFSTWHAGPTTTNRAILPAFDKIKTPLGMLEVNTELRSLLLARAPHTFSIDTPDNNYMKVEHSHIVQYPLIQQVFSKTPIMPRVLPILIPATNKSKFTPDIYDLLNRQTYRRHWVLNPVSRH
jgi:AmmeMemoRadiSam system protein B